jgi:hypothetical protein
MWFRSCLGYEGLVLALLKHHTHIAVGIIEVTEVHALRRAYSHACRFHPLVDPVNAEGALVNITLWMRVAGVIGT